MNTPQLCSYWVKPLRVLSQRLYPTDTSVVLVEVESTRRLPENIHERGEIMILLLEILTVGCGPLPLPRRILAGIDARLSGGSLLSGDAVATSPA